MLLTLLLLDNRFHCMMSESALKLAMFSRCSRIVMDLHIFMIPLGELSAIPRGYGQTDLVFRGQEGAVGAMGASRNNLQG